MSIDVFSASDNASFFDSLKWRDVLKFRANCRLLNQICGRVFIFLKRPYVALVKRPFGLDSHSLFLFFGEATINDYGREINAISFNLEDSQPKIEWPKPW
jgi:hypothetical protein